MNNTSPLKYLFVVSVVAGVGLMYISDFFTPEERIQSEANAYIEGATPSNIQEWEMF